MAASSAIRICRQSCGPTRQRLPATRLRPAAGALCGQRPDAPSWARQEYDGRGKGSVWVRRTRGVWGGGRGAGGWDKGGGQGLRLFFPCLAAVLGCPATTPGAKPAPDSLTLKMMSLQPN
ncbi:hypothetical protein U9M48_043441 [Paspalum notatum var. saurae]|uniref:Uncharacterized protein n=1 Tax=Paspalum notatum var. saurae TaxID=547442 RepID=A0AAQ3XH43_PASNO